MSDREAGIAMPALVVVQGERVASAVGEGAIAVQLIHEYLREP
jgi:hypothetical protein